MKTKDENFGLLYEIMRTRHMHMRLGLHKVGMEVLANSFHHYTKLFYKIMNGEFLFDLPNEWLWDLMDEFLYQFQTFRQKKSQQQEESDKVWSTREVLTTLEKLVQASQIEQLLNSPHQRRYMSLPFVFKLVLSYFCLCTNSFLKQFGSVKTW
jgi:translation initiation factor 3 subunit L